MSENFIAGIAPGGLKEIYEVKILICYLLHSVDAALSAHHLNEIFSQNEVVDYFTFVTALNELKASGHLNVLEQDGEETYTLTELGVETAVNLQQALPSSLREKIVKCGMQLLVKLRRDRELQTEVVPCQNGYRVSCSIEDGTLELLHLSLYAPDAGTAEMMAAHFKEKSTEIYRELLQKLAE